MIFFQNDRVNSRRWKSATVLLLVLLCYSSFMWWHQDDFYIHLQYAKHFSEEGVWGFNTGIASYGTTSPLWVMLLSLMNLVGINLVLAAKVLSVFFALCTFVVLRSHRDSFKEPFLGSMMLLAVAVDHWYRLSAGSGMEATLGSLVVVLIYFRYIDSTETSKRQRVGNGVLAGLAILVRPELFFVLGILFLAPWVGPRRDKRYVDSLLVLAGAALVMLPWIVFAERTFATAIPTTVLIKTGSGFSAGNLVHALVRILVFYGATQFVVLISLIASGILWLLRRDTGLHSLSLIEWAMIFGLPAVYLANQSGGGEAITYRYAAPGIPILVYGGFRVLDTIWNRSLTKIPIRRPILISLGVIVIATNAALSVMHYPFLRKSLSYVEDVCVKYGRHLRDNSAATDKVACYDVGAVGYYSQRHVLDLIGLVSPETIPFRSLHPFNLVAVQHFKPQYYVQQWSMDKLNMTMDVPPGQVISVDTVYDYRFQMTATGDPKPYVTKLIKLQ
jgi:hypothetical protein